MLEEQKSITGRYLSGELRIPVPNVRHNPRQITPALRRKLHNLQNLDVMIPLGTLTVVTGVSGSGKSTLVHDVLYKALAAKRVGGSVKEFCERLEGDSNVREVVIVDQSPIGRTPRSNPATYLKAFDAIRDVFAETPDAKRRGYAPVIFRSTCPEAAAKPVKATARSPWRCSFWRTSNSSAKSAGARASRVAFWKSVITGKMSTRYCR